MAVRPVKNISLNLVPRPPNNYYCPENPASGGNVVVFPGTGPACGPRLTQEVAPGSPIRSAESMAMDRLQLFRLRPVAVRSESRPARMATFGTWMRKEHDCQDDDCRSYHGILRGTKKRRPLDHRSRPRFLGWICSAWSGRLEAGRLEAGRRVDVRLVTWRSKRAVSVPRRITAKRRGNGITE